jgi:D-3-phosphoglycerate dehydrogenase
MKALIADKLSDAVLDQLKQLGFEVEYQPDLSADQLPGAISGYHVLVVRSTQVSADTINAGKDLSLIVRAGAGVNTIDVSAASARGIYVTNCPGRNADAVAELAIGLLVACDRRIADATQEMRSGRWNKKEYGKSQGLLGRTLGIIGMGTIGQGVARRAQGMGMKVLAWSRSLTPEEADRLGVEYAESPLEVARQSDAVSLHLAAAPETKHLVNAEFLATMRDGAILINTARGDVVDTAALKEAIATKRLRVGLDVFEGEPKGGVEPFADTELAKICTCTPHIGASTEQASEAIAEETVRIIKAFRETGRPLNTVNLCAKSPATHALVVRHQNRVGVLAGVLDSLRGEGVNVEEMENTIFAGADTACATLQLDQAPSQKLLDELLGLEHVLHVNLEAI